MPGKLGRVMTLFSHFDIMLIPARPTECQMKVTGDVTSVTFTADAGLGVKLVAAPSLRTMECLGVVMC